MQDGHGVFDLLCSVPFKLWLPSSGIMVTLEVNARYLVWVGTGLY